MGVSRLFILVPSRLSASTSILVAFSLVVTLSILSIMLSLSDSPSTMGLAWNAVLPLELLPDPTQDGVDMKDLQDWMASLMVSKCEHKVEVVANAAEKSADRRMSTSFQLQGHS